MNIATFKMWQEPLPCTRFFLECIPQTTEFDWDTLLQVFFWHAEHPESFRSSDLQRTISRQARNFVVGQRCTHLLQGKHYRKWFKDYGGDQMKKYVQWEAIWMSFSVRPRRSKHLCRFNSGSDTLSTQNVSEFEVIPPSVLRQSSWMMIAAGEIIVPVLLFMGECSQMVGRKKIEKWKLPFHWLKFRSILYFYIIVERTEISSALIELLVRDCLLWDWRFCLRNSLCHRLQIL